MNVDFSALLKDSRALALKEAVGNRTELFLVGGCLRDLACGKQIKDLDLTCQMPAQDLLQILNARGIRCIETGVRHGTVTAVFENSNLEITTFRGNCTASTISALTEDLSLRDFTINSIALSLNSGAIYDPLNGLDDLNSKIIRTAKPEIEKFKDDPLRIMRLIRFGPANNFNIDTETLNAARQVITDIKSVSIERIQHEFSKILISINPKEAIKLMLELGLLEIYFPEALASVAFEQNDFHTEDVFNHTLSVIQNSPAELNLRLAAFFHDLGKPKSLSVDPDGSRHFYEHEIYSAEICTAIMHRLRYSNDLIKSVTNIVRNHMRPVDCGPAGIRRLMRDLDGDFDRWRKFKEADHTPSIPLDHTLQQLSEFDKKVQAELDRQALEKQKKLVVDGHQLMLLGISAGPKLGKLIKLLEEEVIEEPKRNNQEYLINKARQIIKDQDL